MKSKGIAVPYVIWMAIFVVAPLLIIVFYAFTSQAGGFTLENFSTMAQYTGVFGRSFLLAIIATFICLLIGYPLSYWLAQESPAVRRVAMMLIHSISSITIHRVSSQCLQHVKPKKIERRTLDL